MPENTVWNFGFVGRLNVEWFYHCIQYITADYRAKEYRMHSAQSINCMQSSIV